MTEPTPGTRRRPPRILIATVAAAVLLAACGGDSSDDSATTDTAAGPDTSTTTTATTGTELTWDFKDDAVGDPPAGSTVFSGSWAVADDPVAAGGRVLCQTAEQEFPAIALTTGEVFADLTAEFDFLPISGEVDQAAGLAFRIEDDGNYYISRANALENNAAWYLYEDAERSQLGEDGVIEVTNGRWQHLRVEVEGTTFRTYVDGELANELTDETFSAGDVGLWTKADSETCFDNVSVTVAD